jgi:hypothetical protein
MHISFKIIKFYFTLCCSTCFGHHCVHHQELLIAAHAVSGHRVVLGRLFPPALFCCYCCFRVCLWTVLFSIIIDDARNHEREVHSFIRFSSQSLTHQLSWISQQDIKEAHVFTVFKRTLTTVQTAAVIAVWTVDQYWSLIHTCGFCQMCH